MTTIRSEQAGDEAAIHSVVAAAFPTDDEARLVDALREKGELAISLLAVDDEAGVVGYVAFSPVTTEDRRAGLGLAPLAVLPQQQKKGAGALLVRAGLEEAKKREAQWVVVLGDPDYYGRFGFRPAPSFGLTDEYNGGDAFQIFAWDEAAIPRDAGVVHYASSFETLTGESG